MNINNNVLINNEDLPEEQQNSSIYQISNHVWFYSELNFYTSITLNKILTQMRLDLIESMLHSGLQNPTIFLHLNSIGGEIYSSFSSLNTILNIKNGMEPLPQISIKIVGINEGIVASGASLLYVVCDERVMFENSVILIHGSKGVTEGKVSSMEEYILNTKKLEDRMKEIYLRHTKMTEEFIERKFLTENLFTAKECLDLGICDKIN